MALSKITGTIEIYGTHNISSSIYNVSLQDIVTIVNSAISNNSRRNIFGSPDIITANSLVKIASRSKYSKSDTDILNNIVEIINNSESFARKLILGSRKITVTQLINIIRKNGKPTRRPAHTTSHNNIDSRKDQFKQASVIDLPSYGPMTNKATDFKQNPENNIDSAYNTVLKSPDNFPFEPTILPHTENQNRKPTIQSDIVNNTDRKNLNTNNNPTTRRMFWWPASLKQ